MVQQFRPSRAQNGFAPGLMEEAFKTLMALARLTVWEMSADGHSSDQASR